VPILRPTDLQRLALLLPLLVAAAGFTAAGLAIGQGDAMLTTVSLTAALAAMLAFGYRAARTQWVDYS